MLKISNVLSEFNSYLPFLWSASRLSGLWATFSCRETGFSVPAESSGAPAESSGYTLRLWDAAATWPVVIFVVVAAKQRSPKSASLAFMDRSNDRLPHRSQPRTLNGHWGVIFLSIFKPYISLERSCLDLNEHALFFFEFDEKRLNGGRSKFANASLIILRLIKDWCRSKIRQSYRLSKVRDKRTALEALTWRKNETKCSVHFVFELGKAKENAKLLTCCLKNHKQYLQTIVTYDTPNPRQILDFPKEWWPGKSWNYFPIQLKCQEIST